MQVILANLALTGVVFYRCIFTGQLRKEKMKKLYFPIILFTGLLVAGFTLRHNVNDNITTIRFKHMVDNKELQLFDETYTNSFGEPFVISKFRYYISHLSFTGADNKQVNLPDSAYLINEADSLSKIIQISSAAGIKSISFLIGIDSIKNVSGVLTGSLDPMNGMFWTWNSGYVFAKIEGESDFSHAPAHSFSWHVGGFRQNENALRKITLTVNANQSANNIIIINADLLKWFDAVHPVKIAETPICHQPGKLAMQIADNYSAMFSVAP